MAKIIITPRSLPSTKEPALQPLLDAGYELVFPSPGATPSEDQLIAALSGAVGYLAGVERISATVLRSAKDLQAISRNGSGVDNIDLEEAERLAIAVLRAEGANARGVAELALASMLAAARSLIAHDASLKAGGWERFKGFELEGKTLGIVGCGKIGRIVARFGAALGMEVLAFDPYPDLAFNAGGALRWAELEELLERSHVVSLHCPPSPDGAPLLDAARIGRMRRGAIIVNTARAELWDEAAILAALDDGRLAAVTVDAFKTEPPADRVLVSHPRVIATPHVGAYTGESVTRATAAAVANLIAALEKR